MPATLPRGGSSTANMAGVSGLESQVFALIRETFSEAAFQPDNAKPLDSPSQMSMQLEARSGKLELRVQNPSSSSSRTEEWAESCAARLLQAHKKVCKEVQVVNDIQVVNMTSPLLYTEAVFYVRDELESN